MSNAPSKPVSFSRPKVGYFSNRPRIGTPSSAYEAPGSSETLITTYKTDSMEHSSPCESKRSSVNQEIPRVLWNPEVYLPCSQRPAVCPYPDVNMTVYSMPVILEDPF